MESPTTPPVVSPSTLPVVPTAIPKKPSLIQSILKHKGTILWFWIGAYLAGTILMIGTIILAPLHIYWYELGSKSGTLAVLLLSFSLIPGMIRRFGLRGPFLQLQLLLMAFRRQIGISMFLMATAHAIYAKLLPLLQQQLPLTFTNYEIAGLIALLATIPLFCTSNDIAVASLGHLWKKIHMLVYAIVIIVLIHLVLLGGSHLITWVALATVIVEGLSWIYKMYQTKNLAIAGFISLGLIGTTAAYANYSIIVPTPKREASLSFESLMIPRSRDGEAIAYTLESVQEHRTTADCWTVIRGKIYNITAYINVHPGGVETIREACGVDSTEAFDTKGGRGRPHTQSATDLLAGYFVARIGDSLPVVAGRSDQDSAIFPTELTAPTPTPTAIPQVTTNLTRDVVATHRTQSSCWLIINSAVYDVTSYVQYHPGGAQQILAYCGKESTLAFSTKGGAGNDHTSNAKSILASLRIGALNQASVPVDLATAYTPSPIPSPTLLPTPIAVPSTTTLTTAIVAGHNSQSNCWLIIYNNVYDVSQYISYHPGGVQQIVNYCGNEATQAFDTKGGAGNDHTSNAKSILATYKIGPLGSTVATTPTPSPTAVPTPTPQATATPKPTATPQSTGYSFAIISQHNSQSSCWLLINGNVYDVSQYIPYHPGGVSQITQHCGTESTTAFNTKGGGGGNHSGSAQTLLSGYKIGTLSGSVTTPTPTPQATPTPKPTATPTPTPSPTPTPTPQGSTYSSSTVATHNSKSDCWLIINGNVYNVTQYIPYHPGGVSKITNYCGKEASTAFNTRGGNGSHSNNAKSLLAGYLIGTLQ